MFIVTYAFLYTLSLEDNVGAYYSFLQHTCRKYLFHLLLPCRHTTTTSQANKHIHTYIHTYIHTTPSGIVDTRGLQENMFQLLALYPLFRNRAFLEEYEFGSRSLSKCVINEPARIQLGTSVRPRNLACTCTLRLLFKAEWVASSRSRSRGLCRLPHAAPSR